ncbi:MAG TPA: cupin domain-containing protein [Burkholderiales bacterium]|nr:cupin domain-containing protein [Burkholderiales bacterium]
MNEPKPSELFDEPNVEDLQLQLSEALMLAAGGVQPPPDRAAALKQRILERFRNEQRSPEHTLTVFADAGTWKTIMPGIHVKPLHADETGRSFLLRLDPGAVLPSHAHDGDEECMVIAGELYLGDFRVGPGDYHLAQHGSHHGDIHAPHGALVFLRSCNSVHYNRQR